MHCAGQRLIYQMFTEPLPMPGIGPWAGHWDKEPVLILEEHTVPQKRRAKSTVPALQGDRGSRSLCGVRWGVRREEVSWAAGEVAGEVSADEGSTGSGEHRD